MSPFEPDGVYASIPYRVLPDCSIEAMMPGGSVNFKNLNQFMASVAGAATPNAEAHSTSDVLEDANAQLENVNERVVNLPASTEPHDYYSMLLNSIKMTEQNSAQLRALVYERARFNFKRDILYGNSSLSLVDIMRHVTDFELAVSRIEANSSDGQSNAAYQQNEYGLAYGRQAGPFDSDYSSSNNAVQILPPSAGGSFYGGENFRYDRRLEELVPHVRFGNKLLVIMILGILFIGTVIAASTLWHSSTVLPPIATANNLPITAGKQSNPNEEATAPPKVSFPLPTSYGIYVLSDNKLTELEPLPISVPDSRVALSATLTKPTNTTISDNKPAFIIFRRDLLNNAPQKITVRVIARMARQTKIAVGTAMATNIVGQWRIRNISREFKVSPIPGQREMIIARPDNNESLAAGRYALVLNRVGYDFTVEGSAPSPESCLEGFDTSNGSIYTQCRTP
jgi:hypothetical protein